jgi:hypothetical protein
MQGVIKGRHSAIFPNRDGGFERSIGESVGGGGVCVFLLGARSNRYLFPFPSSHPLSQYLFFSLFPNPSLCSSD